MFDVTGAKMATLRGLLWACGTKALAVERTAAAAATVAKERMVEFACVRRNEHEEESPFLFIKKSTRNRLAVWPSHLFQKAVAKSKVYFRKNRIIPYRSQPTDSSCWMMTLPRLLLPPYQLLQILGNIFSRRNNLRMNNA